MAKILAVKTWPGFFRMLTLSVPRPSYLTDWLKRSIEESAQLGYHKRGMDFSSVQKSGVSRILLSGESYSAPARLANVTLKQTWRYSCQHTIFLDASILVYDFNGDYVQHVDFARTRSTCWAIHHSGDVVDFHKKEGVHTVEINLK